MTRPTTNTAATSAEVERAMQQFSAISEDLLAGYESLAARAERVEAELSRTNVELAEKIDELDGVKRHLEAILESLPTGVVVRDAEGHIVRANDAALAILGCSSDELVGRTTYDGLQGPAASGTPVEVVRGGDRRSVAARYSPVTTPGGDVTGSVEILDDRTEIARMTERVHQLDKMAALGTMAGGIAHEIRNPMNAVKGFAALLAREFSAGSKQSHWAGMIQEGVSEADTIIRSLLTFAEPEQLELEVVDADRLVEDVIATVRRDLGSDADDWAITTEVEDTPFVGDRIKLRQALRNLVANAVDAQPGGGSVHLEQSIRSGEVTFAVGDAGPGIPDSLQGRVRDPFFTTRAEGTGLGLALVHTIAELHGGILEVSDRPSPAGGAMVFFRFPFSTQR